MSKPKVLLQLDSDQNASSFDSLVAIDSGVDHLLTYGGINEDNVVSSVHGAMFTRGPKDLASTAIFVGGSDVRAGERIAAVIQKCFFGPIRVSMMLDPNGANTTAVSAVLTAQRHLDFNGAEVVVLGATGPVGNRISRLAANAGARVRVVSRRQEKADELVELLKVATNSEKLTPVQASDFAGIQRAIDGANVVFAAGAAGVELVTAEQVAEGSAIVWIDLNAVPPAGIAGIPATAAGEELNSKIIYGPIGVGGPKMKIHKEAIRQLFESNDRIFDVDEIYQLGKEVFSKANL